MRLFVLTATTATVFAFAISQMPSAPAQGADTQSGASVNQSNADQGRSSGSGSSQSNAGGKSLSGSAERSGSSKGARAEKGQTRVGISTKSREASVRGRSATHIRVNSERGEGIIIKRKRAHGIAMLNHEPRRHIVIKKTHPGVAVTTGETTRATVRSHIGSGANVGAGKRSRETTGSSTTINRSQSSSSSSSKRSSGSQSGNQSRGNAGNQPSGSPNTTTGQGSNR
jgi:hypothetical protein